MVAGVRRLLSAASMNEASQLVKLSRTKPVSWNELESNEDQDTERTLG